MCVEKETTVDAWNAKDASTRNRGDRNCLDNMCEMTETVNINTTPTTSRLIALEFFGMMVGDGGMVCFDRVGGWTVSIRVRWRRHNPDKHDGRTSF